MIASANSGQARLCWLLASAALVFGLVELDAGNAAFPGRNGQVIYGDYQPCDDRRPATGRCGGDYLVAASPRRPAEKHALTCRGGDCRAALPDVSSSGRRVLYEGDEGEIVVASVDGSDATVVAPGYGPAWGPRDRRMVYSDDGALFVRGIERGSPRRLTDGIFPDWSSGGQIAFVRFARRERRDVYLTGAYGRKVRRVTRGGRSSAPSWSPNGRLLAVERGFEGSTNIAVVNRRGRTLRVVTRRGGEDPAWSPDGKRIAFFRPEGRSGRFGSIYVVNGRGGGLRRVASPAYHAGGIDWAPRIPSAR